MEIMLASACPLSANAIDQLRQRNVMIYTHELTFCRIWAVSCSNGLRFAYSIHLLQTSSSHDLGVTEHTGFFINLRFITISLCAASIT